MRGKPRSLLYYYTPLKLEKPLIWGPMSELCGRLIVLQVSNIWFLGIRS